VGVLKVTCEIKPSLLTNSIKYGPVILTQEYIALTILSAITVLILFTVIIHINFKRVNIGARFSRPTVPSISVFR
jgi:hypothetical protein